MAIAKALYEEFCDMDYMDYMETKEQDILLINELLKEYGYKETREILEAMVF